MYIYVADKTPKLIFGKGWGIVPTGLIGTKSQLLPKISFGGSPDSAYDNNKIIAQ